MKNITDFNIYSTLHSSKTVSSKAKEVPKKQSVISVKIIKPIKEKITSSSSECDALIKNTFHGVEEKHFNTPRDSFSFGDTIHKTLKNTDMLNNDCLMSKKICKTRKALSEKDEALLEKSKSLSKNKSEKDEPIEDESSEKDTFSEKEKSVKSAENYVKIRPKSCTSFKEKGGLSLKPKSSCKFIVIVQSFLFLSYFFKNNFSY